LCKAYCSIAELYLTDLCYELDAEMKCEEAIQNAFIYDDPQATPDVFQALANLRLSQSSEEQRLEAYSYMIKAYDRMKVGCEALAQLVGLGSKEEEEEEEEDDDKDAHVEKYSSHEIEKHHPSSTFDTNALELKDEILQAVNALPPFEFRCQSVKILLECASLLMKKTMNVPVSSTTMVDTCVEASIQILGSLLAENDEVPEIFYLLGTAFLSSTCPNPESAFFYFQRALDMTQKIKQDMEKDYVKGMMVDDKWEDDHDDIIGRIEDINQKMAEIQQMNENV